MLCCLVNDCCNSYYFPFQSINKDLRDSKAKVQGYIDEKDAMMVDHQSAQKSKAKIELDVKDLEDELKGDQNAQVCCCIAANKPFPGHLQCRTSLKKAEKVEI